jgi:hypothetical protein
MMPICQPKLTIDVEPCIVLRAIQSLVGILHNNGIKHRVSSVNQKLFWGSINTLFLFIISQSRTLIIQDTTILYLCYDIYICS